MKEKTRRIAAAAIAGLTTVSMLAGCGAADAAKLDGTKVVATIDGTEIPMGILSLATRYQQGNQEYMYNMYSSMYGMQMSPNWDSEYDAENDPGKTNGQNFVENVLDQLKVLYLSKAKAADYGVELSEDLKTKAGEAAKAFMEANSEEAIELLGVTEDQVKEYLEMQAYVDLVEHAIRDEATVNVSDEEANQSSFSYVMINYDEPTEEEAAEETTEEASTEETADDAAAEETADDAAAAEEATEEDAAAEETTEEDAAAEETTEEDAAAEETTEDADAEATEDTEEVTMTAEEKAQAIFDKMMEDPTQDMDEVAKSVDESLYGSTGHFRTAQTIGEEADVEVIDDAEGEEAAEEETPAEDAAAEEEAPAEDAAAEEAAAEEEAPAEDATAEEEAPAEDAAAEEEAPAEDAAAEEEAPAEDAAAEEEAPAEEEAAEEEAPAEDAATTEEETPAEDATAEEDVVESEEGEDIEAVDGEEYEETDDSGYPSVLINSLRGLEDGEMVAEVIDTGSAYYVARLDLVHDEESTQSTRESLENEQRSAHYEEVTTGWTDSCDFTADEEVLKTLVVSDAQKINIVYDQPEETGEETTEDAAAEETSEDAEAEETTEEPAAEETTEEEPAAEDTAADTAEEPAAEDTEADATEDTAADAAEEPAAEDSAADTAEDTAAEKTEEATPTPTEKPAE